jgi:hypothetical protein
LIGDLSDQGGAVVSPYGLAIEACALGVLGPGRLEFRTMGNQDKCVFSADPLQQTVD